MKTTTRLYRVKLKDGTGKPRLVEASHQAAVLRHIAADTFVVDVPSALEATALVRAGVALEQVKGESLT